VLGEEVVAQLSIEVNGALLETSAVFLRTIFQCPRDIGHCEGLLFLYFDSIDDPECARFILRRHN